MKEFLNIKELSDYLNLRKSTLYSMVDNKQIPFFRFGRLIRFKKEDIDIWLESHREKTINVDKKAKEIFKGVKNTKMDINNLVKKSIAEVKRLKYTPNHGKPDHDRAEKEVEHGALS